jgi:predicted porin
MKKTLVAAAVAAVVAAPAVSFADVKISGNVIQEFVSDGDETGVSEDGLESKAAVDLVFSVSEDLGNGMSAFAKIHTLRDNGGSGNADQVVGLKGDFGTIVVGRMEDFSEGKVAAMAATDSSDTLSIEPNGAYNTARAEGGMAYVSPSFNGLTFGVAGYALPNMGSTATSLTITSITTLTSGTHSVANANNSAVTVSGNTATIALSNASSKDADANIDATDIMIEYANAGLTVRVAQENVDGKVYGASKQDQKTTSIGASYKMDNITLVGYSFDVDNGKGTSTNDSDGWFVGAKMAMGANTFGIGYSEETDTDTSGNVQAASATQTDDKNWMVSIDHALSKRTSITAAYESNDDGTAATADNDKWAVGLKHVF